MATSGLVEFLSYPGPLLLVVLFLVCHPLATLLRFLWAALAAFLLRDCDFATKLLPERRGYWKNKVAWVTGASSGIGLSLCRMLASRRCFVILSSRNEGDLVRARDDAIAYCQSLNISRSEDDFLILPFDMKKPDLFPRVVDYARRWKGKLDVLFSNAGVACRGVMLPSTVDNEVMQVNLLSQMAFVKLVTARMIQQQSGQIVFTNSMSSRITLGGRTAYSAAKGALLNFAYGLSRELRGMGSPVHVTSVLPGYVKTSLCDRELYADGSLPKGAHMAEDIRTGLSSDRTAELMLRGSSRHLSEIWVGKNPDLFYMYAMYYFPDIANRFVDFGATSYARSIEQEIRERRYAIRKAGGASALDKKPQEREMTVLKKRKSSGEKVSSPSSASGYASAFGLPSFLSGEKKESTKGRELAGAEKAEKREAPLGDPHGKSQDLAAFANPGKGSIEPGAGENATVMPGGPGAVETVANAISDAVAQLGKLASFGSDTTRGEDEENTNGGEVRRTSSLGEGANVPVVGGITETAKLGDAHEAATRAPEHRAEREKPRAGVAATGKETEA
ncbi:oxidoreductase, short chain dehydrogenase/reductase family protein [Besnoitia besnoiti]|uniref:Oxidoreductase, short chain dehydrogenase/reductase family protein n=1 Tax=Besnoitia besnoiti TaxID=94643 RepID=A0A2A9MCK5_BESBE|nr:oxidoreductase, short chain dehydrogenase/reductase family protein [Besnoitia besnoiti]PFH35609.1 oxidoreductase, short chain dehydrogenase/reductase family protein [Besnoitia besnoiti]